MGRKYHLWLLSRKIFLKEKRHKVQKASSCMTQPARRKRATLLSIRCGAFYAPFVSLSSPYLFVGPTPCGNVTFQIGSCWETHPKFVSCNFNDQKSKMHCALIFMGWRWGGGEERSGGITFKALIVQRGKGNDWSGKLNLQEPLCSQRPLTGAFSPRWP